MTILGKKCIKQLRKRYNKYNMKSVIIHELRFEFCQKLYFLKVV